MNKKTWFLILAGLIAFGVYYVFWEYPDQLRENVYNQDGYEVNMVTKKLSVKFSFQNEWSQLEKGEGKDIEKVLLKKYNSTVLLESVYRDSEGALGVNLNIKQDFDSGGGRFLSHIKFNKNGTFSSYPGLQQWNFYNKEGRKIKKMKVLEGTGYGPREKFGVRLSSIKQIRTIQCYLYVYEYEEVSL